MSNILKRTSKKMKSDNIPAWMFNTNPYTSIILCAYALHHQNEMSKKKLLKRIKSISDFPAIDDPELITKTLSLMGWNEDNMLNEVALCISRYGSCFIPYIDGQLYPLTFLPMKFEEWHIYPVKGIKQITADEWNSLEKPTEVGYIANDKDIFINIGSTYFGVTNRQLWKVDEVEYPGLIAYSTAFNKDIMLDSFTALKHFANLGYTEVVLEQKKGKWNRFLKKCNITVKNRKVFNEGKRELLIIDLNGMKD